MNDNRFCIDQTAGLPVVGAYGWRVARLAVGIFCFVTDMLKAFNQNPPALDIALYLTLSSSLLNAVVQIWISGICTTVSSVCTHTRSNPEQCLAALLSMYHSPDQAIEYSFTLLRNQDILSLEKLDCVLAQISYTLESTVAWVQVSNTGIALLNRLL